jgi:tetratricopeptide (TPR) repeat protein
VEYSHSNLSQEAQRLLLCLAPFSGFIFRGGIPNYAEELRKLEPFQDYNFSLFDGAIQEAIHWGLLEPIVMGDPPQPPLKRGENASPLLTIQPVFPYFLKAKLNGLDSVTREALQAGFKNHYQGLAGYYNQLMESKEPQKRQLGIFFCRLEYENLYQALQICLANQESINIFFCLDKYFELINDIQSNLKLSEFVCQSRESYLSNIQEKEYGYQLAFVFERMAKNLQRTQQYEQARQSYMKALQVYDLLENIEERQKQLWRATNFHQLGWVAQDLREYEEARNNYQQALAICVEFGDRYGQAKTYHQLGWVAQDLREYEEARNNYQQALAIFVEFGDRYNQAGTYGQLGTVASELREYEEARNNYQQALDIFVEFSDRHSSASTYHNLGNVALKLREYEEARNNYQQALDIFVEFRDRYNQARIYHQLGIVAQDLREYEEARNNYQQALDIFVEFSDRYSSANTYNNLGVVAEDLEELQEAKTNFLQALSLWDEFNDQYSLETYSIPALNRLYQATQDPSILEAIAQLFGTTVEEVLEALGTG